MTGTSDLLPRRPNPDPGPWKVKEQAVMLSTHIPQYVIGPVFHTLALGSQLLVLPVSEKFARSRRAISFAPRLVTPI